MSHQKRLPEVHPAVQALLAGAPRAGTPSPTPSDPQTAG